MTVVDERRQDDLIDVEIDTGDVLEQRGATDHRDCEAARAPRPCRVLRRGRPHLEQQRRASDHECDRGVDLDRDETRYPARQGSNLECQADDPHSADGDDDDAARPCDLMKPSAQHRPSSPGQGFVPRRNPSPEQPLTSLLIGPAPDTHVVSEPGRIVQLQTRNTSARSDRDSILPAGKFSAGSPPEHRTKAAGRTQRRHDLAESQNSPPERMATQRKRLLIVEDECIVAFDLAVALEAMGYAVVATASSSEEALRFADAERPDLVLMDINIAGGTDGIETGCRLRARHHVPLVYLTANVDATTLSRALATEPDGYLVKPYNEHSLRTTIEVAFVRHEAERTSRTAHERERAQLEQKYSDMTSLARRLRRESTRDPLTGLCNRRRLDDIAKREICFGQRDSHPVGFVLLDLDRFKQMNDTFGHPAGDTVLRAVADLLRSRIRVYDVACRYGGEEIVIVVPGETSAGTA